MVHIDSPAAPLRADLPELFSLCAAQVGMRCLIHSLGDTLEHRLELLAAGLRRIRRLMSFPFLKSVIVLWPVGKFVRRLGPTWHSVLRSKPVRLAKARHHELRIMRPERGWGMRDRPDQRHDGARLFAWATELWEINAFQPIDLCQPDGRKLAGCDRGPQGGVRSSWGH